MTPRNQKIYTLKKCLRAELGEPYKYNSMLSEIPKLLQCEITLDYLDWKDIHRESISSSFSCGGSKLIWCVGWFLSLDILWGRTVLCPLFSFFLDGFRIHQLHVRHVITYPSIKAYIRFIMCIEKQID